MQVVFISLTINSLETKAKLKNINYNSTCKINPIYYYMYYLFRGHLVIMLIIHLLCTWPYNQLMVAWDSVGLSAFNKVVVQTGVSQTKMEPSSVLGPHQRARAEITNEVQIKTDGKKSAKRTKTTHVNKGNTSKASWKLFVKRATKKQWSYSYMDLTVVKDDLIYR
jgi:hypothetical protein